MSHPGGDFTHLLADIFGVGRSKLEDAQLLSGLMIAAAGAVGQPSLAPPLVRTLPSGGLAGLLLLEGCHIALHTYPARELLLLDVLAEAPQQAARALDVFQRRLGAREIRSETRARG